MKKYEKDTSTLFYIVIMVNLILIGTIEFWGLHLLSLSTLFLSVLFLFCCWSTFQDFLSGFCLKAGESPQHRRAPCILEISTRKDE